MKVITESFLRNRFKDQTPEFWVVEAGQILTPSAATFLNEKKVAVRKKTAATVSPQPATATPAPASALKPDKVAGLDPRPRYISALDGGAYDQKPEYMTQIHGRKLVPKDHPRIILRGLLDSLQADMLLIQHKAWRQQKTALVSDLGDLLVWARNILKAEVTERPLEAFRPLGLSDDELREQSHHPQRFFNVGHLLPSHDMDEFTLLLNQLRTRVREVELAAVKSFKGEFGVERLDILQALNRMSSAVYVMMLRFNTGKHC